MTLLAFALMLILSILGYLWNRQAATAIRSGGARLHSLSGFHAAYSAMLTLIPVFALILIWLLAQPVIVDMLLAASLPDGEFDALATDQRQLVMSEISSIAAGQVFGEPAAWKMQAAERLQFFRQAGSALLVVVVGVVSLALIWVARGRVAAEFRARTEVERMTSGLLVFCSVVAILTTVGIIAALLFETIKFLRLVPLHEFLFGVNWEPQIPIREDQVAASGAFGVIPVLTGTLVITVVALVVAVPVGLMSAIYLNEFAPRRLRKVAKPVLEMLAGVPTVVYGFFAILTVAPAIRAFGASLGIPIAPNTALAAGGVMGVMLIPFISSFTDDALSAVPRSLRDGALSLGATRAEAMLNVLFPAAIPGIVGGVLLAVSRAIGETMIVVMAAGLIANLTVNPLEAVTTVTVQIVTLLIGDTSFDNPKTLSAFALGMLLFLITLVINVFALRIVRKYRETYD